MSSVIFKKGRNLWTSQFSIREEVSASRCHQNSPLSAHNLTFFSNREQSSNLLSHSHRPGQPSLLRSYHQPPEAHRKSVNASSLHGVGPRNATNKNQKCRKILEIFTCSLHFDKRLFWKTKSRKPFLSPPVLADIFSSRLQMLLPFPSLGAPFAQRVLVAMGQPNEANKLGLAEAKRQAL